MNEHWTSAENFAENGSLKHFVATDLVLNLTCESK